MRITKATENSNERLRSEFYLDRQCRCRAGGNSHRPKDASILQELRTRGHFDIDVILYPHVRLSRGWM